MIRRPNLTMEQVKRMKSGLSQAIHKLVEDFQTETGVQIQIDKDDIPTIGREPSDWGFELHITGCF